MLELHLKLQEMDQFHLFLHRFLDIDPIIYFLFKILILDKLVQFYIEFELLYVKLKK